MTPSSRDRITVDLHGLKAALFERAIALGVSPSALVRKALASTLGQSASTSNERLGTDSSSIKGDRVSPIDARRLPEDMRDEI